MSDYLPSKSCLKDITLRDGTVVPLRSLIRINPDNLVPDYELQAPWMAVIALEYTTIELEIEIKERSIKEMEAAASLRARKNSAGTKLTEATVRAKAVNDPEVREAYEELWELKREILPISAARTAFYARKEMLISLGAEVRLDRKGQ